MSQMYFANKPDVAHDIQELNVKLLGHSFKLLSDAGVFSKNGVDFGTQVLLNALDYSNEISGNLLDVGCGYGPIGLSLAKSTQRAVTMIDVNERAIDLSQKNAENNQINNVNIFQSNLFENVTGHFAGIISNPPIRAGKKVVHEILATSYDYLLPQGTLTIVIQKKQGAASAQKKMNDVFGNVEIIAKRKGYFILQSRKIID